ncbi:hypothetical protein HanIR_Chr02g0099051 [Helianthus annuus]|nr:hypothetical protein HanIR_Chr02g0099051 [Helianthus annuus]
MRYRCKILVRISGYVQGNEHITEHKRTIATSVHARSFKLTNAISCLCSFILLNERT